MAHLYVGTSGWAYPTWKPAFYPEKLAQKKFLNFYASKLNAVEVNYTFRQLVKETTVQNWIAETPEHFRFTIKAHQVLTHIKRLKSADEFLQRFLGTLEALERAGRLGPLLFQLPPNFKADQVVLSEFLKSLPRTVRAAFEFRHESWLSEPAFVNATCNTLRERNIALCVAETEERDTPDVVTADFAYYRYRKPTYTAEERQAMGARIHEHLAAGRDVFAYFKHEETPEGALYAVDLLRIAGKSLEISSPGMRQIEQFPTGSPTSCGEASEEPMETEKAERQAAGRSRISHGALGEVERALRDYKDEVWEAGRKRDGIREETIKTYTKGPETFVAWLKYEFTPGQSRSGPTLPTPGINTRKLERPPAKRSRISLSALAEAEDAFEDFVREVLWAKIGERATNQLGDHAEYFIRWLKYDFAPGARKGWGGPKGQ